MTTKKSSVFSSIFVDSNKMRSRKEIEALIEANKSVLLTLKKNNKDLEAIARCENTVEILTWVLG